MSIDSKVYISFNELHVEGGSRPTCTLMYWFRVVDLPWYVTVLKSEGTKCSAQTRLFLDGFQGRLLAPSTLLILANHSLIFFGFLGNLNPPLFLHWGTQQYVFMLRIIRTGLSLFTLCHCWLELRCEWQTSNISWPHADVAPPSDCYLDGSVEWPISGVRCFWPDHQRWLRTDSLKFELKGGKLIGLYWQGPREWLRINHVIQFELFDIF